MSLSSVFVVGNALRLKTVRLDNKDKIITVKGDAEAMNKTIIIKGMSCGHCVMFAKKALMGIDGVIDASVELEGGVAKVTLAKELEDSVFVKAIEDAGFSVEKIG
jgi:Cu+-exporting ATPase